MTGSSDEFPPGGEPAPNDEFRELIRRQIELLGEDPDREGLRRTPERVAASLAWLTRGYEMDAKQVVGQGIFDADGANGYMIPLGGSAALTQPIAIQVVGSPSGGELAHVVVPSSATTAAHFTVDLGSRSVVAVESIDLSDR